MTSDLAGVGEVLGSSGAGITVPVGDARALARGIRTVLGDAGLRERMRCAARERSREFDVERMVDRTLSVYERVLAERNEALLKPEYLRGL